VRENACALRGSSQRLVRHHTAEQHALSRAVLQNRCSRPGRKRQRCRTGTCTLLKSPRWFWPLARFIALNIKELRPYAFTRIEHDHEPLGNCRERMADLSWRTSTLSSVIPAETYQGGWKIDGEPRRYGDNIRRG